MEINLEVDIFVWKDSKTEKEMCKNGKENGKRDEEEVDQEDDFWKGSVGRRRPGIICSERGKQGKKQFI